MGLGAALIQVAISYEQGLVLLFPTPFPLTGSRCFLNRLFIVLSGFSVLSACESAEIPMSRRAEFCVLVLMSCLAMCLAAGSAELLLSFIALRP